MTTIKYFMWGYQRHFTISAKVIAEAIFNSLDRHLKPSVFLVGFLTEESEDSYPICIEPEDCGYEPDIFASVKAQATHLEAIDPEREILYSHPIAEESRNHRVKIKAFRDAIQNAIRRYDNYRGVISFCSVPILVQGYRVSTVIQFDRDIFNSYYALAKDRIDERYVIEPSLLNAVVVKYLDGCAEALTKPEPGAELEILGRDADEIIRSAGKKFMYTPAWKGGNIEGIYGLFHACNTISSMHYEGAEGVGQMLIGKPDHPNIEIILSLSSPVEMNDHRAVRKLLEISSDGNCLLTDSAFIYGIGRTVGLYDQRREDLFLVNFTKHYTWELQHAGHVMMRVIYGQPHLPRLLIDKDKFTNTIKRIFQNISPKNIEKLWALIIEATKQKHGTMVIVSTKARDEAKRLEKQSINIDPILLTTDMMKLVTTIDGAVLIDPNTTCYAIGVILDGIASKKGSSSRGARYNSAIRYTEGRDECIAIVVSVDGSVDLIPNLVPQIRKASISDALEKLRALGKDDIANIPEFNKIMGWFTRRSFYLDAETCNEVNRLRREIESRFPEDTTVRVLYQDFVPNEEMNSSYFIDNQEKTKPQ